MKNFTYYQPTSAATAVGLLDGAWGKVEILAGGTDLLDLQKEYVAQPDKVVSITAIKDLAGVKIDKEAVTIGAATKLAEVAEHKELQKLFPALTTACGEIGGPQIRNMGTLGGSLCQRNRCWYFRDEHVHCLLKGGDKCFALDGDNRYHAIFTQGHKCVIVNPSTTAPPLIAPGATVEVLGENGGRRSVEVEKFFQAPSSASQRETVLSPKELVTAVRIPIKDGQKSASYEVRHKQSYDWPLVQAAVAFGANGSGLRIVLGHVAPTPIVAAEAAKALEGKGVTEASAEEAGKAAAKGAKPLAMNAYKVRLVEVAVKRALLTAAGGKKYWEA